MAAAVVEVVMVVTEPWMVPLLTSAEPLKVVACSEPSEPLSARVLAEEFVSPNSVDVIIGTLTVAMPGI